MSCNLVMGNLKCQWSGMLVQRALCHKPMPDRSSPSKSHRSFYYSAFVWSTKLVFIFNAGYIRVIANQK